ncbi:Pro-rich N-terminal domain-containing protein [Streptomyces pseudogriseolus]|uniref:Pro-rich N-terminal domain-containing protein n=1 Tax=Streptomyces pseudogriseolus TaxID=36817 RepID=UPI003FA258CA
MQHAVGSPLPPPHQPGHGPAAGWSPAAHHPGQHPQGPAAPMPAQPPGYPAPPPQAGGWGGRPTARPWCAGTRRSAR